MTVSVACIVEGQGDVASIPIIVRRLAEREGVFDLRVTGPFRVQRYKIVRPGELERVVERAARSFDGPGGVLVVLDADDDLPCVLGPALAARAAEARSDVRSCVVLARREKEAWYAAAIRRYSEVTDQPAFAALFDLDQAGQAAPSFEKLRRALRSLVADARP